MRPGPPPPPRVRRRPLGPTPRYHAVPRWGLTDQFAPPAQDAGAKLTKLKAAASTTTVRAVLIGATTAFAIAAAVYMLRYLLLLINRTVLLPQWVALPALVVGVLASVGAIAAVCAVTFVLTAWLIDRRAAAYRRYGRDDPRPAWTLWAGCLTPVVSLFWAPVYLIELAHVEGTEGRLRKPITQWWVVWAFSTVIAVWATWTRRGAEPQAIADNTVTMIIAYLVGTVALLLLLRVFDGFVGKPAHRPQQRWVVVSQMADEPAPTGAEEPADQPADEITDDATDGDLEPAAAAAEAGGSGGSVESQDREPAA